MFFVCVYKNRLKEVYLEFIDKALLLGFCNAVKKQAVGFRARYWMNSTSFIMHAE